MAHVTTTTGLALGLGLLVLQAGSPAASAPLTSVSASPDVTVDLDQTGGGTFADEDVAIDDTAGTIVAENLGALADADEVVGYELLPNGDRLVCFDEPVALSGPFYARPGDVVRFDGSVYTLVFDATATGVPDGVVCDAVTVDAGGSLLLSFDTAVALLDGGGTTWTIQDEDLLRVAGPTTFALFFDGSAAGIPDRLDVNGAHLDVKGDLVLSFDVSGTVGGIDFDDDDLAHYAPASGSWSLAFDLSAGDSDWIAADADAISVPEPGELLLLASGVVLIVTVGRRRIRR